MRKLALFTLFFIILAAFVYLAPVTPVAAATDVWTCPTPQNSYSARLDLLKQAGRNYLIDPLDQGFVATTGNEASLQYASNPPRWLVGGVQVSPAFDYIYHITYMGPGPYGNFQPTGEAWIGTLPGYASVYFTFMMPIKVSGVRNGQYVVEYTDHPNCGYGSGARSTIDALLKPRR